jgi:hypothetical protein
MPEKFNYKIVKEDLSGCIGHCGTNERFYVIAEPIQQTMH